MKRFLCVAPIIIISISVNGQADFSRSSGHVFQPVPTGFVSQLPLAPSQVLGNYYLSDEWRKGKIFLSDNQTIEDVPFRYEAERNQFEIKSGETIKVLAGARVLFFNWFNNLTASEETYLNLQNYIVNGTKFNGFARIVSDGEKFKLFCITQFSESQPTYNVAMDVGRRNPIIKKEDIYYLGRKTELVELSRKKKKLAKTVSTFAEKDVTLFLNEQNLNFRSERDFALLTQELNK